MFVIYNGINIVVKYYGIIFGYEKGTEFIKSGNQKKVMQKIINISTAIGVMVIGALIAQYVKINVGTVIYTKGTKLSSKIIRRRDAKAVTFAVYLRSL